jgi:hypothetical protein
MWREAEKHERTIENRPPRRRPVRQGSVRAGGEGRGARRYFADFVAVRRQRVQTIAFVDDPFWAIRNGCRFGW